MVSRHVPFITRCAKYNFAQHKGSGSLTEEQTHPGSWRNFATSYFVIALLSPNVSSRFLKVHDCGEMWVQKLFIDKVRSNVSPAFESKLICFPPPSSSSSSSSLFVIFFPLCFSDWEVFFFCFFLISFTHRCSCTCSQLIITTSLHSEKSLTHPGRFSCLFARQDFIPPPPSVASPRASSPSEGRRRLEVRSCFSDNLFLGRFHLLLTQIRPVLTARVVCHLFVRLIQ